MGIQVRENLRSSHNQSLVARNVEVRDLKKQRAAAQKKATNAQYDGNGAKSHLQQPQSGQEGYRAPVSFVHYKIAGLGAGLFMDRIFLMHRLEHSIDQGSSDSFEWWCKTDEMQRSIFSKSRNKR